MYDLFDTFFNPWYDDSEYNKKAPKQQAPQNTQNLMKSENCQTDMSCRWNCLVIRKKKCRQRCTKAICRSVQPRVQKRPWKVSICAASVIPEAVRDHSMWASISVRKISGQVSRTVFLPCLFQRKIRQRQKKRNILPLRNPL